MLEASLRPWAGRAWWQLTNPAPHVRAPTTMADGTAGPMMAGVTDQAAGATDQAEITRPPDAPAGAGGSRPARLEDLYSLEVPGQPALSPDGARVVYVLRTFDAEADEGRSTLWQVPADGGDPVRLTRGTADTAPAWSPDGSQIAFLRGGGEPAQVWLLPATAGEPRPLTRLPLGAGPPRWSPDGTRIAFTAPTDLTAPADVTASANVTRSAGVTGSGGADAAAERRATAPAVIDRLSYKADGAGLLSGLRGHLHVVDVATGETRQLTRGDWHAGAPEWSPDGRELAFAAARGDDWDLSMTSAAYIIDVDQPDAPPRLAGDEEGIVSAVAWEPGGGALLLVVSEARAGHAGLRLVPLADGKPADLTAGLDRNVMPGAPGYPGGQPAFTGDGKTVLFCARGRGCTGLYAAGPDGVPAVPVLA